MGINIPSSKRSKSLHTTLRSNLYRNFLVGFLAGGVSILCILNLRPWYGSNGKGGILSSTIEHHQVKNKTTTTGSAFEKLHYGEDEAGADLNLTFRQKFYEINPRYQSLLVCNGEVISSTEIKARLFAQEEQLHFQYVVTSAYIQVKSTYKPNHSPSDFQKWIGEFYNFQAPMVLFLPAEDTNVDASDLDSNPMPATPTEYGYSSFVDFAIKARLPYSKKFPTLIVPFEAEDMEVYGHKDLIEKHFVSAWGKPGQPRELCYVWAEKVTFMRKTILLNPYQSKYFFWIDMGNFREFDHRPIADFPRMTIEDPTLWPNVTKLEERLGNGRFWIQENKMQAEGTFKLEENMKNTQCDSYLKTCIETPEECFFADDTCGNFMSGTAEAVLKFGAVYATEMHRALLISTSISKNQACIDQVVYSDIVCRHPDLVTILKAPPMSKQALWTLQLRYWGNGFNEDRWTAV